MAETIRFPLSTGQVVLLLRCRERHLHESVRAGVVRPQVVAGRRLWMPDDVLRVAKHLALDTPEIRNAIESSARADKSSSGVAEGQP